MDESFKMKEKNCTHLHKTFDWKKKKKYLKARDLRAHFSKNP